MKRITSAQHLLVKHLVKVREERSYRHQNKSVVVVGNKLVEEMCERFPASAIKCLLVIEGYAPPNIACEEIIEVPEAIMKKIAGVVAPEPLLAEVAMPAPADLSGKKFILVMDGIADPGNMGTLLRTALALGWQGAWIMNNCVDPYNDKVLRAARGATFRLPFRMGEWEDLIEFTAKNKLQLLAADLEGASPAAIGAGGPKALVLSNEAQGLSVEARAYCKQVTVPMKGDVESLNVAIAGGILMYCLI